MKTNSTWWRILTWNYIIFLFISVSSCQNKNQRNVEIWKEEILKAEREFAAMASNTGIAEAFTAFAAEDAVLERNDSLIVGRKSIRDLFLKRNSSERNHSLSWEPDFVDVSESGDLGYTYGKYNYIVTDSTNNIEKTTGIFHTVWKRQKDGSWKHVWD